MSILLKGLRAGRPIENRSCNNIKEAERVFDGSKLDYLRIEADITTHDDCTALIRLLEIHLNCFRVQTPPVFIKSIEDPQRPF